MRATKKDFASLFVHDQVEIAAPIALFRVSEAVPFFGERQEGFAEELEVFDPDGQLVGLGAKQVAGDANNVAEIEKLKKLERFLADNIEFYVELQPGAIAQQVSERRLAVGPQRHDAAGGAQFHSLC